MVPHLRPTIDVLMKWIPFTRKMSYIIILRPKIFSPFDIIMSYHGIVLNGITKTLNKH
jgi:hypothetical protein